MTCRRSPRGAGRPGLEPTSKDRGHTDGGRASGAHAGRAGRTQRLRAENASLRSGHTGGWARAGRWTAATVLLLVSALLFAVAVVAVFVRTQVLDTDRYVETVAPLARDPAIQNAIANRITAAILAHVDLKALADELRRG